ncbi:MAG: hypothetical protein AAF829_09255 [Pseudomonadota bacterium]
MKMLGERRTPISDRDDRNLLAYRSELDSLKQRIDLNIAETKGENKGATEETGHTALGWVISIGMWGGGIALTPITGGAALVAAAGFAALVWKGCDHIDSGFRVRDRARKLEQYTTLRTAFLKEMSDTDAEIKRRNLE